MAEEIFLFFFFFWFLPPLLLGVDLLGAMCNLLTLRTAVASGFATLFCPQVKLGVVCSFLSASAPLPGSLVLPQSSVALYSEAVGTFLAFKRLICHGEWMVSFPNPSLPGTQGD